MRVIIILRGVWSVVTVQAFHPSGLTSRQRSEIAVDGMAGG